VFRAALLGAIQDAMSYRLREAQQALGAAAFDIRAKY
jgi:hypothetical protein